jgi:hypothetical protein
MSSTTSKTRDDERQGKQNEGRTSMTDKATEAIETAKEKAQDMAHKAGEKLSEGADKAREKTEDALGYAGGSVRSLGEKIQEKGPQSGMLGSASKTVGEQLEGVGSYLESRGLSGIGEDLTSMIKRNPIPTVLISIGVGFLLARAFRS